MARIRKSSCARCGRAPEADAALAHDARRALGFLAALDEGPREALALFHLHDLSYQEIASALEVPMGTVMK